MNALEFGWYLPTNGDTTAFKVPEKERPPSLDLFERIIQAAEGSGFEYLLLPVIPACWEAYISGAFLAARTQSIKPLLAARPGYINPVLLAKMITTFDQLTSGRLCINLIAGVSEQELQSEGITYAKEDRYALMDEEVSIMKALWTADKPIDFHGRFHTLHSASISPAPFQQPYPRLYLGGGSAEAWEVSAKHCDVHLFWGDTPERIASNIAELRRLASHYDRRSEIEFGMRLQIICRERADDAWAAARTLVAQGTETDRDYIKTNSATSVANSRVQELASDYGEFITPHLWTGITQVRGGAGIAVVGNPEQCAATLQDFIDVGCRSFCLSGYPHDEEAERFGRLVRPLLAEQNQALMASI